MTRGGRPRRFVAEDELRPLLDADLVAMRRNGYQFAAVAEFVAEADLSTRSCYRHFASKDQLHVPCTGATPRAPSSG
jgi:AcrR family transcriptional regulator